MKGANTVSVHLTVNLVVKDWASEQASAPPSFGTSTRLCSLFPYL